MLILVSWRRAVVLAPLLVLGACASAKAPVSDGPVANEDTAPPAEGARPDETAAIQAILVAPGGKDTTGCGLEAATACHSIGWGIGRAAGLIPPRPVLIASGSYEETIELRAGVHLRGGYTADFQQGPGKGESVVDGGRLGEVAVALRAKDIAVTTEVEALTLRASSAQPGASSYGVLVLGYSPGLALRELRIVAGNGGDGAAGAAGQSAASGNAGGNGKDGAGLLFPALACNTAQAGLASWRGDGAAAPTGSDGAPCADAGGNGGNGEGVTPFNCPGESGKPAPGVTGATASCSAATAGQGGQGGKLGDEDCNTGVKTPAEAGYPGCDGSEGASGIPGVAGAELGPLAQDGTYLPAAGGDGQTGKRGVAGGGGGGGGGYPACTGLTPLKSGGGGGGGGSSGCGGTGGKGGGGGGGSFGVYIVRGLASQSLVSCTITTGNGGRGGAGGPGGPGGAGGAGGSGGKGSGGSGAGGAGGKGGSGGAGGGGGGGGGGPSVGVFVANGDLPSVSGTTFTLGVSGGGGAGGGAGNAGVNGLAKDIHRLKP
jgi:hypothetical protein